MSTRPVGQWLLMFAAALIVATVAASLYFNGSPSAQRALRLDERRISDLGQIKSAVDVHVVTNQRLPKSLQELQSQPGASLGINDPVSGQPYRYEVIDARHYRLCATFDTDTAQSGQPGWRSGPEWQHPKGAHCFMQELPKEVEVAKAAAMVEASPTR